MKKYLNNFIFYRWSWWNSLFLKNNNRIARIPKTEQMIIGTSVINLNDVYVEKFEVKTRKRFFSEKTWLWFYFSEYPI